MRLLDRIINKTLILFFNLFETKPKPIEPATPQLVAKRFRQLFADHGVQETQIPRIFPKLTLSDLKSDKSLIKKLTPELINDAADLFKIRSEWLEGIDNAIYSNRSCYKRADQFFSILSSIQYSDSDFPFRVITPEKSFDYKSKRDQPFSILYVEKIAELGEEDIFRYYLDVGWSWNHWPCRIQLKAMALLYGQQTKCPVTLYIVPADIYDQIEDLELIPHLHLRGALISNPSIEDYVTNYGSKSHSRETNELPVVHQYIEDHQLVDMKVSKSTIVTDEDTDPIEQIIELETSESVDSSITEINHQLDMNQSNNFKATEELLIQVSSSQESLQKKAGLAKHEPTNELKRDCIKFWLETNKRFNQSETARRFYKQLPETSRRLLTETNAERTLSTAIKDYKNRNNLELVGKLPYWLKDFNPEN